MNTTYEEGCLCEGDTMSSFITYKCGKCFTRKHQVALPESCTCISPSFINTALCGNCKRRNLKYVRAARVAAGQVIAQHFFSEYKEGYHWRNGIGEKMTIRNSRKMRECFECANTRPSKRLKRRFGETPRTFRTCLERKILDELIKVEQENPDEELARTEAEKLMHLWMNYEVMLVVKRRRVKNSSATNDETNWFGSWKI